MSLYIQTNLDVYVDSILPQGLAHLLDLAFSTFQRRSLLMAKQLLQGSFAGKYKFRKSKVISVVYSNYYCIRYLQHDGSGSSEVRIPENPALDAEWLGLRYLMKLLNLDLQAIGKKVLTVNCYAQTVYKSYKLLL